MATIPGTKYAQGAPSESTGQVLMNPPSEGGGQQVAAGIEKMGAAIVGYAINVQKQEMSVEYYEKKRQIDEAGWSAHNAVTGDEEADNKLWEKFESDAQAIAQSSKYKDVNSLLARHLNQVAPNWHQGIYTRSLTIRKENARDQLKLEWTKSLENGDTKTANELLNNALKLGAITQTEHDNFMKIAPAQAHLLRAERESSLGNNEAVLAELDQTKDMKLTTEQLKQKEILKSSAEKAKEINVDEIQRSVIFDMHNNRDLPFSEKLAKGQKYLNQLNISGITGARYESLVKSVENWMAGKEKENNSLVYTKLFTKVTQLKRGLSKAEQVQKDIIESYPSLDNNHFESLSKYFDQTVEGWNADILNRLEKEAKVYLAPNLQFWEKAVESQELAKTKEERMKYKSIIERLQEPAKRDADRIALYLDQCRKWLEVNPESPSFYENGKKILAQYERYSDAQIDEMMKRIESGAVEPFPLNQPENPYKKEYPEAYYENGNWYVMQNGKRYRLE